MSILAKVFDRGANFPVRHMNFNFEQAQHPLFRDNPWGEYWLATLSAMFPAGERFFVHSVRNLQHQAKADHLKKDIAAFIGQEAMHAKEHELLNELIQRSGLDTTPTSVNVEWLMAKLKKFFTPVQQLAITSAAEHFTAIIARQIMQRTDLQERLSINEDLKSIWLWHAVEESEHKSVAFDLYQAVSGSNLLRLVVMPPVTLYMIVVMAGGTLQLGIKYRSAWEITQLKEFWNLVLGRNGFLSTLWQDYLDYYKLDFHPAQHNSLALEARTKEQLKLDIKINKPESLSSFYSGCIQTGNYENNV